MNLSYNNPRSAEDLMHENLLVKHRAGSHAYGTNIATSDEDYRGIFYGDPINILTPFFPVRESTDITEEDTKYYELAHFMKLCLDCNPNIVETLWVDRGDILHCTDAYNMLRLERSKLLSAKVAFTFSGYAVSQLKRIKGHNKWINNPQPEEAPKPYQYLSVVQWLGAYKNLNPRIGDYKDGHRLVPFGGEVYGIAADKYRSLWDSHGGLNDLIEAGDRELYRDFIMIVKWNKQQYKEAKENHRKYWEWKNNRNESRSELEEAHGYDTKHAMHLVRLLRMGEEILTEGVVHVRRPDAEELLAIRNGAWKYEELVKYAEHMDHMILKVLYTTTELRKKADIKTAAKLLMRVQEMVWDNRDV